MQKGLYYIIGGVRKARNFKNLLSRLIKSRGNEEPNVLYIGAAAGNNTHEKNGFLGNVQKNIPGAVCDVLDLDRHALEPENSNVIGDAFEKADIIFFEAGSVEKLQGIFNTHGLKDHCLTAYNRGAVVGGLCAGGTILSETMVYEDSSGYVVTNAGMGLIEETSTSCHIYNPFTSDERIDGLVETLSNSVTRAIGIASDQMVMFYPDGTYCAIENSEEEPSAFSINEERQKTPIPKSQDPAFA